MLQKYIIPVSLNELNRINTQKDFFEKKTDRVVAIELREEEISYDKIFSDGKRIDIPFAIMFDFDFPPDGRALKRAVRAAIPLLLDTNYYEFLGNKLIFIKSQPDEKNIIESLNAELSRFGLHTAKITAAGKITKSETENGFVLPGYSNNCAEVSWVIMEKMTDASNIKEKTDNTSVMELIEKNFELARKVAILKKNVFDLNNYYRFVRGETTFKYHNRDEKAEGEKHLSIGQINPDQISAYANAMVHHPVDNNNNRLAHYKSIYENTPVLYKKFGALLKIITGKRGTLFYINSKEQKIFIDFLSFLPEEKRIEMWYYYEYEVLPKWYKRLGKHFVKH
jgi:hypothetical protein